MSAKPPRTIDGYVELLARAIFASGLSWQAVEPRWPAITRAFEGFSARKVADYETSDLERVMSAPGMIRNRSKTEAVVSTTRKLAELRDRHGSVSKWLDAMDGFEPRHAALTQFPYVGRWGAYYVLAVGGYEVPSYEEWSKS